MAGDGGRHRGTAADLRDFLLSSCVYGLLLSLSLSLSLFLAIHIYIHIYIYIHTYIIVILPRLIRNMTCHDMVYCNIIYIYIYI